MDLKKIIILISLFTFLSFPALAGATDMDVVTYENNSSGKTAYGINGYSYLPTNLSVNTLHVSSLYVWQMPDGYNMVEGGWAIEPPSFQKYYHFAAWQKNGVYYLRELADAATGSWHYYTVRNVTGTNDWKWHVNGQVLWITNMGGWKYGTVLTASERDSYGDSNWSHFKGLRKRDSSGNYYYWTNLTQWFDTDPDYRLNKISNTEHYVIK